MRQANYMTPFDVEYVNPVANISRAIPRYYPNTISEQLNLSGTCEFHALVAVGVCVIFLFIGDHSAFYPNHAGLFAGEAMHALLKSYGMHRSGSWYKCQAMLSFVLGTYPRVSLRIKNAHPGWRVPWGSDRPPRHHGTHGARQHGGQHQATRESITA